MGKIAHFLKNLLLRLQLVQCIICFSFIWAAIFSSPSANVSNYIVQLNLTNFHQSNGTDSQLVNLEDAGLAQAYRFGVLGYCNGTFDNNMYKQGSCFKGSGDLDLNEFFQTRLNSSISVPTPEISNAHSVSRLLRDGMLACAAVSLVVVAVELINFLFIRRQPYSRQMFKLFLCAHLIVIILLSIIWPLMCAISFEVIELITEIAEFYDGTNTQGIVATWNVTTIVLLRVAFSFGLVTSVSKSILLTLYAVRHYKHNKSNKRGHVDFGAEMAVPVAKGEALDQTLELKTVGDVYVSGVATF